MSQWKTHLGFPQTQETGGFLLVLIIDALGSGISLPLTILYFHTAGFSLPMIGLALAIATLCTLPLTFLAGSLVDRLGARRVTASSQLIQALGLFGYLFVHTVPLLFLMALLITGGIRMFYAAHTALVAELASPDERDRWYGLAGAIRNGGGGDRRLVCGLCLRYEYCSSLSVAARSQRALLSGGGQSLITPARAQQVFPTSDAGPVQNHLERSHLSQLFDQ